MAYVPHVVDPNFDLELLKHLPVSAESVYAAWGPVVDQAVVRTAALLQLGF
jgi:hypothetical protein